eukprot:scaffold61849_cov20-Tisochrysis_lutea.AAC.1
MPKACMCADVLPNVKGSGTRACLCGLTKRRTALSARSVSSGFMVLEGGSRRRAARQPSMMLFFPTVVLRG